MKPQSSPFPILPFLLLLKLLTALKKDYSLFEKGTCTFLLQACDLIDLPKMSSILISLIL